MSLSQNTKYILEVAMANSKAAAELAAAVDSNGSGPAAAQAALGATANLTPLVITAAVIANSTSTAAIPAEPTMAEVNTAIDALKAKVITVLADKADNADAETLRTEVEARLDAIEAKIDAILAAFVAAGMMA